MYMYNLRSSFTRTSKQTWLEDRFFNFDFGLMGDYDPGSFHPPPIPFEPMRYIQKKDEVGYALSERVQDATELLTLPPYSSESYQIANYGLGGQYSTHHDSQGFFEGTLNHRSNPSQYRHNAGVGDRFVTVMGYLSDVEVGGATVFPLIGVASPVERGAVVLWFNLMADGRRDKWTYHGGCPVAVGSKWITNKWVFYNDQFLEYPCGLGFEERHAVLQRWRMASKIPPPDDRVKGNGATS